VPDAEGPGGGTENEGADPSQPVESQADADKGVEAAVGRTQFTGNQAGEAQADADKGVEAAVAATQFTGNQAGESQADADAGAEAAVAATAWSNVGTEDVPDDSTPLTADWTNVGLQDENPNDPTLEVDWSNVGLQHRTWASVSMPAAPINPGLQLNNSPGLSVFFTVSLDVIDLGMWSKISGLGMQIEHKSRPEAAMSFFEHHLPGHITYNHITLERPLSSDSQMIMDWISAYHMLPIPTAGQIICLDQTGTPILSWDLIGVCPVSWKGPTLDAHGLSVVTEQLTLAHMGFL
jgi:phage tail-like protein